MNVPVCYVARGELTSPKWCRAFAAGCGARIVDDDHPLFLDAPVAMFGSVKLWPLLMSAKREKIPFYYGDHAYFRRFHYFRITRNALMHDGVRGEPRWDRFQRLGIEIKPWMPEGKHVLVCPPDIPFGNLHGFNASRWHDNVLNKLIRSTDRPIRVRSRLGAETRTRTLREDLKDCFALVTHSSNAAVEAVLEGVPVVCTNFCSASAMGIRDPSRIEYVIRPEGREVWAAKLAANQWTLSEMASGECWRELREDDQDERSIDEARSKRMVPSRKRRAFAGMDAKGR